MELADLDDLDAVRVHADQLLERGDGRGELIALACEAETRGDPELHARLQPLLAAEAARLGAGPLAGLGVPFGGTQLDWRRGFVDVVRLSVSGDQPLDLACFADDPALRLVRAIEIEASEDDGAGDLAAPFAALAARAAGFPRLRELAVSAAPNLGSPYRYGPIAITDIAPLVAAFPRLARLALVADPLGIAPLALPELRRLQLRFLAHADADTVAASTLPALDELDVAFRFAPGSTLDQLAALLDAAHAPRVLRLEIASGLMAELLPRLATSRLARAVRTLRLPMLYANAIPALDALAGFERLEINAHRLDRQVREALAALGNVHFG